MSLPSDYHKDGIAYFAKNSDRSPNEPHLVIQVPGKHHQADETVSCTYITIPQVTYTREMILCKPSWIWGAEMGVNEDRVAIGNEAVFTKAKRAEPALIGMDLLRLALERAGTARDAVTVIISLLETYGQGGNCGFDHPFFYDNSFLVADPKEVYVLETSGKNYTVERAGGKCAISNRLTIGANNAGQSNIGMEVNFAKRFTEPVYSYFSAARERRKQVMEELYPDIDVQGLFGILRSHERRFNGREFTRGSVKSVCMHGGGLIGDHTTGSLTAVLRQDKPVTLWCTGASTPCIAAFKPVFFGSNNPPVFQDPDKSRNYWLQREYLHRAVIAGLVDYATLRSRICQLETVWLSREREIMGEEIPDMAKLYALSQEAAEQEQALINEFFVLNWQNIKGQGSYGRYWKRKNEKLRATAL